ncbi:MAG: hypothetical protein EB000_03200, partial [Alphaproteobacteria bacterium]|nr:hypothetical protein [Alphaproteobacteria bacterium]
MGQVVQFADISSLEALEMFIPSDYYNFLHTRMLYNPTEIIQAFTAEAFLKHPCKCYDVTNYTAEEIQSSLALQEAWPVPTPALPKFAGKTYMAYVEFNGSYGPQQIYISYSFDSTGENVTFAILPEPNILLVTQDNSLHINGFYKSVNSSNTWLTDLVIPSPSSNPFFSKIQECGITFNDDYSIITGTTVLVNLTFQQLLNNKPFYPTDYYNFLNARMVYNPNEIIPILDPTAFLQNPLTLTRYDLITPTNPLVLQTSWPVPTPPPPPFAGKTYMAYLQLGSLNMYNSYKFDSTGTIVNISSGATPEESLDPNNVFNFNLNNIYKSPFVDVWQSDYHRVDNMLLFTHARINFTIN